MMVGIKYQKLTFECNHSRKHHPTHNKGIPQQARRKGKPSIREECKARVTVSWPLEPLPGKLDRPYISLVRDVHTHDLTPNFDAK